jgi:hypothetical protein
MVSLRIYLVLETQPSIVLSALFFTNVYNYMMRMTAILILQFYSKEAEFPKRTRL